MIIKPARETKIIEVKNTEEKHKLTIIEETKNQDSSSTQASSKNTSQKLTDSIPAEDGQVSIKPICSPVNSKN